jgi:hypothetical protein
VPLYLVGGRHSRTDHLLCSTLHGQNIHLVLTILGGSTSVVEPTVCTTLPEVDKADTSLVEAPMAQTLMASPGSKASVGNPADNDPDLLNFAAVESWIACQTSSRLQMYWPNSRKLDCLIWHSGWFGFFAPWCWSYPHCTWPGGCQR